MARWWLVAGIAGCATAAPEATPEDDMASMIALADAHREEVQVSADPAVIADLEARYRDDWHALADPCTATMAQDCTSAPEGELSAADWLRAATKAVDDHVDVQQTVSSFQDAWFAEDDHHDDIASTLDGLATAYADQCPSS